MHVCVSLYMALLNAVYNWGSIKALNLCVLVMNVAGIIVVVIAIMWAIRLARGFASHLYFIAPGDSHLWPTMLILVALICAPVHVLGIKTYVRLRFPMKTIHNRREDITEDGAEVNRLLFLHAILCLVSGSLVIAVNIAGFLLSSTFQQKFRDGLMEAIENYGSDAASKAQVDDVQIEYHCCGSKSYRDWFHVPWLRISMDTFLKNGDELDKAELEEQSTLEDDNQLSSVDVPFSCCSSDIPEPCIHHNILSPSSVYDYNPERKVTIATTGCKLKIISRARMVGYSLTGFLILLFTYQLILSLLSRLLQSAYSNEFYIGPEKNRYHVWIFGKVPQAISRRDNEETAEAASPDDSDVENEEEMKVSNQNLFLLRRIRSKITSVRTSSEKSLDKGKGSRDRLKLAEKENLLLSEEKKINLIDQSVQVDLEELTKIDDSDEFSSYSSSTLSRIPLPPIPSSLSVEDERKEKIINDSCQIVSNDFSSSNQNMADRKQSHEAFSGDKFKKQKYNRESGGAETRMEERKERISHRSHAYDRFRGTFQYTLNRRENIQGKSKRTSLGSVPKSFRSNIPNSQVSLVGKQPHFNGRFSSASRFLTNNEEPKMLTTQTLPVPPALSSSSRHTAHCSCRCSRHPQRYYVSSSRNNQSRTQSGHCAKYSRQRTFQS